MARLTSHERPGWPNFLIIGAGRCGTTSLHYYLAQHPDVYVCPVKETNFFAYDPDREAAQGSDIPGTRELYPIKSRQEYLALFASRGDANAVGEAAPLYLYAPGTAARIHAAIPHARIIAMLRNPAERAYSGYLKYVRDGVESRTFGRAIEDERSGRNPGSYHGNCHYFRMGCYARHLAPYFERFGPEQIAIFLFEDLERDTEGTLAEMFRFLEVDDGFIPDCSVRYNAAGVPKSRLMHRLLSASPMSRWAKRMLLQPSRTRWLAPIVRLQNRNLAKPELSPELRGRLLDLYRQDISALQSLIGRDLGHWLA